MRRVTYLLPFCLAIVAIAVPAATAKSEKTMSYDLTLLPDPTPAVERTACASLIPIGSDVHPSIDDRPYSIPEAGTLKVVLQVHGVPGADYSDWDSALLDAKNGRTIAASTAGLGDTDIVTQKFKQRTDILIRVCNFVGSTSGTVTVQFTPR